MKVFDKINLKIFSVIIIIISIVAMLFSFDIIQNFDFLDVLQENVILTNVISVIFILLAIKSLFITGKKEDVSNGVLLENSNGKLFISKESIIGMIETDLKSYSEILSKSAKIAFDEQNNLLVELILAVRKDASIKELSGKIQNSVKTAVKKSADLDVKFINIKIKNVADEDIKK